MVAQQRVRRSPTPRRRRRRRRGSRRRAAGSAGDEAGRRRRRPAPSPTPRRRACPGDSGAESIVHGATRGRRAGGPGRRAGAGTACRGRAPTSTPAPWPGRPPRRAGRWPGRASGGARRARPWPSSGSTSVSSVLVVAEPRQPALHAVEQRALGEALPLLAAPRLGADEGRRRARTSSLGISSRAGKITRLGEVVGRALVVDAERVRAGRPRRPTGRCGPGRRRSTGTRR